MVPPVMTKLVSWWLFPANQYAIIGVHHPSRVCIENLRVVMMPTLSSLVAPWCHLWWQSWHHDDFIFSVSVCHNREHSLSGVCTKNWELLWCQLCHHLVAPWCHLRWQSWQHDDYIFSASICHNRGYHPSRVYTEFRVAMMPTLSSPAATSTAGPMVSPVITKLASWRLCFQCINTSFQEIAT